MFSSMVLALARGNVQGESVDISTIAVSAMYLEFSNFTIQAKDDGTHGAAGSIAWPAQIVGAGWQKSLQYVELAVQSNLFSWRIDVYTNNTAANTGLQKGGLISSTDNTKRLVLGWVVSGATISIAAGGIPGELITNRVMGSTTAIEAPWRYLKDKGDQDDANTTAFDESWAGAYAGRYTSVLSGAPSFTVLPYQSLLVESPAHLYLEGDFSSSEGGMNYTGTINFDFTSE